MNAGLTSIIIPTYDLLGYTKLCIESIQQYTREPYELIVVDNGSQDGTVQYLKKVPEVRIIKNGMNLGCTRAKNQGIDTARGENLLFLNNDTVVTENWLSNLLRCLYSAPDIGLVSPKTNNSGNKLQVVTYPYNDISQVQAWAATFNQSDPNKWFPLEIVSGFCMLTTKQVIEKIGEFDEQFKEGLYADNDLSKRVKKAGYRAMCAGDTFVYHFRSVTFKAHRMNRDKLIAQNKTKFKAKWGE